MVNWRRFSPADFEYDFDADKLAAHRVTFEEALARMIHDTSAAIADPLFRQAFG